MKPNVMIKGPITREQLAAYAEASGDPNQIHLDAAAAQAAGLPGVIAHGMLTMAFFGEYAHTELLALHGPSYKLEELSCRFRHMTFLGDVITVSGTLRLAEAGRTTYTLEARKQNGEVTATGTAVLKISH